MSDTPDLDAAFAAQPAPPPAADAQGGTPDLDAAFAGQTAPPPQAPTTPRMAQRVHPHHAGVGTAQAAPARAGSAPPAPNLSWSDVGSQALQNFVPSFKGQVTGMLAPLLPQNWGGDVQTAVQLAKGLGAKAEDLSGAAPNAARSKDEALVNQIGSYYAQKYGSVEGFKRALAQDPASVLTDVASVASIPAGGEGLAAKVPGAAGEALQLATKGAGAIARATNPLGLTARAAGAVLPKVRVGAFAPAAARVISKAFPNLSTADLAADPAAVSSFRGVMGKKGISVPAAKEGLLRTFDPDGTTPIPTSMVTGRAGPVGVAQPAAEAAAAWRGKIGAAATGLTGAAEPSPSDLGSALEQTQIDAHNAYTTNYANVAAHGGKFDAAPFSGGLPTAVGDALSASNLPTDIAGLAKLPQYGTTTQAMTWLQTHIADLAANDALTPQALMEARKGLGFFWNQAMGSDEKGVGSLIEGLDNHIRDSATGGLYQGGDGAAVASDMQNAIGAFRQYKTDFANRSSPTHGAVASAMKSLIPDQAKDPVSGMITGPAPEGSTAAAQGALGGKLIGRGLTVPPGAEKLYGKLQGVLGGAGSAGGQALDDYIRQSVTQVGPDGALLAKPDQIHQFLNTPLADVFTPEEQGKLKQIAEAQRLVTTPPVRGTGTQSAIKAAVGPMTRRMVGAGLGHLLGGPMGAAAGFLGESALEPALAARATARAMSGAPKTGGLFLGPGRIASGIAAHPPSPLLGEFYGAGAGPVLAQNDQGQGTAQASDVPSKIIKAEGQGHNPRSSANGPGQMLDYVWGNAWRQRHPDLAGNLTDQGLAEKYRYTPQGQAETSDMARDLIGQEQQQLSSAGLEPNALNTYLRHFLGSVGRVQGVLKDDPNAPFAKHLSPLERSENPREAHMTVGQVLDEFGRRTSASGGRIGYASGGKIDDVGPLVERLMTRMKQAKEGERRDTKPLLQLPDNAVAKALDVAQQAI